MVATLAVFPKFSSRRHKIVINRFALSSGQNQTFLLSVNNRSNKRRALTETNEHTHAKGSTNKQPKIFTSLNTRWHSVSALPLLYLRTQSWIFHVSHTYTHTQGKWPERQTQDCSRLLLEGTNQPVALLPREFHETVDCGPLGLVPSTITDLTRSYHNRAAPLSDFEWSRFSKEKRIESVRSKQHDDGGAQNSREQPPPTMWLWLLWRGTRNSNLRFSLLMAGWRICLSYWDVGRTKKPYDTILFNTNIFSTKLMFFRDLLVR